MGNMFDKRKKTSAVLELATVDYWVCILTIKPELKRKEKQGQDG